MKGRVEQVGESIFRRSGTISGNVYFLNFFRKAIIDTGHPSEVEDVFNDFLRFGLNIGGCEYILNTHSHSDHTGGNAFFRKRCKNVQIIGSPKTTKIKTLADETLLFEGIIDPIEPYDIDLFISENFQIDLGEVLLVAHETPGHSADSISFFIPSMRWLFSGDVCFRNIVTQLDLLDNPNDSLMKLKHTYQRMLGMNIDKIVPGHGPIITDVRVELQKILLKMERYEAKPELIMIHIVITIIEYYLFQHKKCLITDLKKFIRIKMLRLTQKNIIEEISDIKFENIFDRAIATMGFMDALEIDDGKINLKHTLHHVIYS